VFTRFSRDDQNLVRGVLHDLTETGLVFSSGSGQDQVDRATTKAEQLQIGKLADAPGLDALIWAFIYREGPVSHAELDEFAASQPLRVDEALDRHGRYYASRDALQGLREGTLTAAQAEQLAAEIGWASIDEWSAYPDDESCPDAGNVTLWKPGAAASCTCGCPDSPIMEAETAALAQMYPWIEMLVMNGDELTTPIAAIAVETGPASGTELAWPLDRAMTGIAGLVQTNDGAILGAPVIFDEAADAASLRALRARTTTPGRLLQVRDDGVLYTLYLRDELPDEVTQGIALLLGGRPP
jgi:hypothetical protein